MTESNHKLIEYILNILNREEYKKVFNLTTKNRKYTINQLLMCVMTMLSNGDSYRKLSKRKNLFENFIECESDKSSKKSKIKFPSYCTIYKFYKKLVDNKIIKIIYDEVLNIYMKSKRNTTNFFMDSTLTINKNGVDCKNFNGQLKKHKTTKTSLITDSAGIIVSIHVCSGSQHDASIIINQIDTLRDTVYIKGSNHLFVGDAAYDSEKIRSHLKNAKLGGLLTPKNKRNSKKVIIIPLTKTEKNTLKKRFIVEHTNSNLKQYKRLSLRYDKYANQFLNYNMLAASNMICNKLYNN